MTTYRYECREDPKDGEWHHPIISDDEGEIAVVIGGEQNAILIVNALNLQNAIRNVLGDLAGILKEMNR